MSCKDKLLELKSFIRANFPQVAEAKLFETINELLSGKYVIVPLEKIRDDIAICDQSEGQFESTRIMTFAAHSKISVNPRLLKTRSDKINKMLFEALIKTLEKEKKDFE